jgi:ribonuclease HI
MPHDADTDTVQPYVVFADGACTGNPGPGGWGAIIATPDGQIAELGGGDHETTNNRMELTAVGKALRFLEGKSGPVHVYTDSSYVIFGATKWVWGWRSRDWKTAEGKDVANVEYWKRLMALLAKRKGEDKVEFKYVRGHTGVPGNERCDEIAVAYAKGRRVELYKGPLLKYEVAIFDIPEDTEPPPPKTRETPAADSGPKAPAIYLSLVGHVVKRHATWKECEGRIKGVPGAKFKKCADEDEVKEVLARWGAKEH